MPCPFNWSFFVLENVVIEDLETNWIELVRYAKKLNATPLRMNKPFIRTKTFSYRFAEQVLNSKLAIKEEIINVLTNPSIDISILSRPQFNEILKELFTSKGWQDQPAVFGEEGDPTARMDFLKERVGIEVEFGHSSFLGIDILKFQVASYSSLDKIDVGVYVVTTKQFQKILKSQYNQNWEGSLAFEKVQKYLPHFKSAIQIPIYVIGIDV